MTMAMTRTITGIHEDNINNDEDNNSDTRDGDYYHSNRANNVYLKMHNE